MAMGNIYIGQKLIILLHFWAKKGVSKKKKKEKISNFDRPCFMLPKLKRVGYITLSP